MLAELYNHSYELERIIALLDSNNFVAVPKRPAISGIICPTCEDGSHTDAFADVAVHQGVVKCDCPCHSSLRL